MDLKAEFEALKEGRVTDAGKSCVQIAAIVVDDQNGTQLARLEEARAWVALSLRCDKATTPEALRKIEKKLEELDSRDADMMAMRRDGPKLVGSA